MYFKKGIAYGDCATVNMAPQTDVSAMDLPTVL